MNNFFKRSIILIYFITLVGCGYTPMMTNNSYNFKVEIESLRGDEDINNYIKNNIESKILMYKGALHGFNVNIGKISDSKSCLDEVSKFLKS